MLTGRELEPWQITLPGYLLATVVTAMDPWQVFLWSFLLAGASGFAAALRSAHTVTPKQHAASTLYSALVGLIIALLWHSAFEGKNLYCLIGLSGAAGFGGVGLVDLLLRYVHGGGLTIVIRPKEAGDDQSTIDTREEKR